MTGFLAWAQARYAELRTQLNLPAHMTIKVILVMAGVGLIAIVSAFTYLFRYDVFRYQLDPRVPFITVPRNDLPDYRTKDAWALLPDSPDRISSGTGPADVFFLYPTVYDGGKRWNDVITNRKSRALLDDVYLPNYAGVYQRIGRVFAPRYRQASLFSHLTNREDARLARAMPMKDVSAAFDQFLKYSDGNRPIVLVGVEQGAVLLNRLLSDKIATQPELKARIAGVYLIEAVLPAFPEPGEFSLPICERRHEAGCKIGYASLVSGNSWRALNRPDRALVLMGNGDMVDLDRRPILCVNPVTGSGNQRKSDPRQNLGAANAAGVEWGLRPALQSRQVGAICKKDGLLHVTQPNSPLLRALGSWFDRRKVPQANLFYADLEADAMERVAAQMGRDQFPDLAPPIDRSVEIKDAPIHRPR